MKNSIFYLLLRIFRRVIERKMRFCLWRTKISSNFSNNSFSDLLNDSWCVWNDSVKFEIQSSTEWYQPLRDYRKGAWRENEHFSTWTPNSIFFTRDSYKKWYHSIETWILHIVQVTERIWMENTRIWVLTSSMLFSFVSSFILIQKKEVSSFFFWFQIYI